MARLVWGTAFCLSVFLHGLWPFAVVMPLYYLGSKNPLVYVTAVLAAMFGGVILFSGCPLSYLNEYLAVKAGWKRKLDYNLKKSIVYKVFSWLYN